MNWAYIAGFFDGEGSLGLNKLGANSNCWRVSLAQGTVPVLEEMKCFLEEEGISSRLELNTNLFHMSTKNHKSVHQLRITVRADVVKFCRGVLPYCIVKKTVVQDAIRFLRIYPPLHRYRHKLCA